MSERAGELRVLVVAHDFPPHPSPQSMRIGRLVEGLLAEGSHVHVLAGSFRPQWSGADVPNPRPGLTVTRGLPSRVDSCIDAIREWRKRIFPKATRGSLAPPGGLPRLNWKGKVVVGLKDALSGLRYPGESHAWLTAIRPEIKRLIQISHPDCVVLSHEPPAGLMLHAICRQHGIPVIAELGDPVCAPYTPRRWRSKALRLESRICHEADHVVVTCEATRSLLRRRHLIAPERITVLTQGFPMRTRTDRADRSATIPLRLLYTGRFYSFRDPGALLAAVAAVPEVELLIASSPSVHTQHQSLPCNVRVMDELPHAETLRLQASADVLVNIANQGLPQVPGKFFEYFGLPTPVLHLTYSGDDEQAELLRRLRRGWVVANDTDAIIALLRELVARQRRGQLVEGLDLSDSSVEDFSWTCIGNRFARIVCDVAANPASKSHRTLMSMEQM